MSNLDVDKDFLSNVDYLKSLVKEVKSKTSSDYDSNLIYEVTYANMYVTDLLSRVKEPKLAETINDIKVALDLIIADIPIKDVEDAQSKSDYTKILRAKYKNVDDGSFEEEVAYSDTDGKNVIESYFKRRLPAFALITCLLFVQLTGVDNILNFIGFTYKCADSEVSSVFNIMSSLVSIIIGLMIIMIYTIVSVGMAIDLAYLSMPIVRVMLEDNERFKKRLVSIYATELVEEVDGNLIKYRKIKSFDRIKRNKYWLNSMLDSLNMLQRSGKKIDKEFANSLVDLHSNINDCKEHSKEWYMCIAKIEFMHDKYIKMMEGDF